MSEQDQKQQAEITPERLALLLDVERTVLRYGVARQLCDKLDREIVMGAPPDVEARGKAIDEYYDAGRALVRKGNELAMRADGTGGGDEG